MLRENGVLSPIDGMASGCDRMPQRGIAYQRRVKPWKNKITRRRVLEERRISSAREGFPGEQPAPQSPGEPLVKLLTLRALTPSQ